MILLGAVSRATGHKNRKQKESFFKMLYSFLKNHLNVLLNTRNKQKKPSDFIEKKLHLSLALDVTTNGMPAFSPVSQ